MLSKDVALWNLQRAPKPAMKLVKGEELQKSWNVMFESTQKLYSYRLSINPTMHPLERHWRWHPNQVQNWFDEGTVRRLLEHYEGTHDFRAFASDVERVEKKLGGSVRTIRTVYSVKLIREPSSGNLRIDFLIKGALYKQVRNMVGTALDVCQGRISEDFFCALIKNNGELNRSDNPSKPAPPEGLTLERVYFEAKKGDSF
jgi:tRNA pseudouridine38-40 synthase